jgi:hypothetical protein
MAIPSLQLVMTPHLLDGIPTTSPTSMPVNQSYAVLTVCPAMITYQQNFRRTAVQPIPNY